MPLRLIELVLPLDHVEELKKLLENESVEETWYDQISEDQTLIKILARLENTEHLMDQLDKYFSILPRFRLILLPVAASLPRIEEKVEAPSPAGAAAEEEKKKTERINREELYNSIKDTVRPTRVYFAMVSLSTVVAAIGIMTNNVAVVIGAMVIAPLLGPVIAMSLAATLGDPDLARLSLKTSIAGILLALVLSTLIGYFLHVNPDIPEIASRTRVGMENVVLALAAGFAGALAFTAGVPGALVGVMVAVALLPPLVTMGLLLGAGFFNLAWVALLILLINILCVSLAGTISFWVQGIRPSTWWEEGTARRATLLAVVTCSSLLALLIGLFVLLQRHGSGP